MRNELSLLIYVLSLVLLPGCGLERSGESDPMRMNAAESLIAQFVPYRLTTDVDILTERERQMIPLLIEAAEIMNRLFLEQSFGPPELAQTIEMTSAERRYFQMNYGPWNRIGGNAPFIDGVGEKPLGANYYPADMTKAEFEAAIADSPRKERAFKDLYTLIRRDASGRLTSVPYHEAFATHLAAASSKLREAAELAEDPGLRRYLELRAAALLTDQYRDSDLAWMDMKENRLDIVIGPIEVYEDQLFGYKAGYTAYVLVKDLEWSRRLSRYAALLPSLQEGLPVPETYRAEIPGSNSDLNAYDAVYYAGESNAGTKTIAINLPNDEQVQIEKGTRRLQLKNTIRAKFEHNLLPISEVLIADDQRRHITFDAFFENTMFHEVAHGLGIKNTIDGNSTVRRAMKEYHSTLEEGKADVLGLYMVNSLHGMGELGETHNVTDNFITFTAGIFRSIRFGATSAHGRANLIRFNFFEEMGAFARDPESGTYRVDPDRTAEAMAALSERILRLQGDGDYEGAAAFVARYQVVGPQLQEDLDRLATAGIPIDVTFEQGVDVLGL